MTKKYGTLDEAMTAGTGMNKDERKNLRDEVRKCFKIKNSVKKGSKKWKAAMNKIAELNGWPQTY